MRHAPTRPWGLPTRRTGREFDPRNPRTSGQAASIPWRVNVFDVFLLRQTDFVSPPRQIEAQILTQTFRPIHSGARKRFLRF